MSTYMYSLVSIKYISKHIFFLFQAFCESLEEQVFQLQSELRQRDKHISTMQKEVVAQKGQIDSLHTMLRFLINFFR